MAKHGPQRSIFWWCALGLALASSHAQGAEATDPREADEVGYPTFASPHSKPIVKHGASVYVVNTPADKVDVIHADTRSTRTSIHVGIDPVSLALRPDGRELWVSNHISDTVSVIDTDPESPTFEQVVATIQDIDPETFSTRFDEPVGIAFASTANNGYKAYVALSTSNRIAIIDVASRSVTGHLEIRAQDPRAISVQGEKLYVVAFESNNQSQLSGCMPWQLGQEVCTFDVLEHVVNNNNVLSRGYDADIVKNPRVPDRDLFVFDTASDRLEQVVTGVGTLLYGLVVDSRQRVFVTQTHARNVENGRAGTSKHGLLELGNRAFLNRITRLNCLDGCRAPVFFDLEPMPPEHPAPGMALATPFAIEISKDDSTLVVTAAGSNMLFTVNADTGEVMSRVPVSATPRGIALVSDESGAPQEAWVLGAVENSVSVVKFSEGQSRLVDTLSLEDPTHPDVKQGRIIFNDASVSSTGTFSCESCHPDNNSDQLLWVLDTPMCDAEGCTQIPPRLTMPVRGLRDTAPYHWDGIPGDPFGGINTASLSADAEANCAEDDATSCARHLVDGTLASVMCDQGNCPLNDDRQPGRLNAQEREALARFLLSVPYPPAQARRMDNELNEAARQGFFESSFVKDAAGRTTGAQTCGDCHKSPFLTSTNTPGSGMDAPTFRGAHDRWMLLPQGRVNVIDLLNIAGVDNSFRELDLWTLAGFSTNIWEMVTQSSTGFSGSFARQTTLSKETAALPETVKLLASLETAAEEGAIRLKGEGVLLGADTARPLTLEFAGGTYHARAGEGRYSRAQLLADAGSGKLVMTFTGRAVANVDLDHPQPAIWESGAMHAQTRGVQIPFLSDAWTLTLKGRNVEAGASIFVNGRRAAGEVACGQGELPNCEGENLQVTLSALPQPGGVHFLQLQNPQGLFSNDMMFFSEQSPLPPRAGNLIASGGSFPIGEDPFDMHWNTVEIAANSIEAVGGAIHVDVESTAFFTPWHAQISHAVMVAGGQQYTLCYDAKAEGPRFITAYMDSNLDRWQNISGGQHRAYLNRRWQRFSHTFTVAETDLFARVAFDFAQSPLDVQIDNIGVFEGSSCTPQAPRAGLADKKL